MYANIDDQLYLLALIVSSNNINMVKNLLENTNIEFDMNFNYKIPIQNSEFLVEEMDKLVNSCKTYENINEILQNSEFMNRLFKYYAINELNLNPCIYENNEIKFSNNEFEDEFDELLKNSIINNSYFQFNILHIAVITGNCELVKCLLEHGANIKPFGVMQINPIHLALYQCNNKILSILLEKLSFNDTHIDKVINEIFDDKGYNPTHIAIYYDNLEALDILYKYGADFNYVTDTSPHPLIWAIENSEVSLELIQYLLDRFADPNVVDKTHNYTPLFVAVIDERIDLIKMLIRNGADANKICVNQLGCCAMQVAIERANRSGNLNIVELLLNMGTDPTFYADNRESIKPKFYGGPLIDAISFNNSEILKLLLSYGANPHTDTCGSYSPLCTACFVGNYDIVKTLLLCNVDPTLNCLDSNTPLTIAISMNKTDIAKLLLQFYKTNKLINHQDRNGDHALLYAAVNRNYKMIRELLNYGADANLCNKFNTNALWYCVYNNDSKSLTELLPYIKIFDNQSSGVNYKNFTEHPPELIYTTPLNPIELAIIQFRYRLLYLLSLSGAIIETQNFFKNIIITKKILNEQIYDNKNNDENRNALQLELKKIEKISDFLKTPLSLKRQCRIFMKNIDASFNIAKTELLPNELRTFLLYKLP